jgi:hypothetical protein
MTENSQDSEFPRRRAQDVLTATVKDASYSATLKGLQESRVIRLKVFEALRRVAVYSSAHRYALKRG